MRPDGRDRTARYPAPVRTLLARLPRLRLRSHRDRSGLHFVEGLRAVLQALDTSVPVEALLYSEVLCWNPHAQQRVRRASRAGVPVIRLAPEAYRAASWARRASGLGAILRQHWTRPADADPNRGLCWIGVGRMRSPGNLGTVLRTAEAAGAGGAIFLGDASDPFDPDVVRATMGGLFHLRLVRMSLEEFRGWSRTHGCRVLGTSPAAPVLHTEVPVERPLVILFGEERKGLSPDEIGACTHTARIPIRGRADSLNVGVASGVMLYEVLRRAGLPATSRST